MKLITEASQDDKFNVQLDKLQTAVQKLEAIAQSYTADIRPVQSQELALDRVIRDLENVKRVMFSK